MNKKMVYTEAEIASLRDLWPMGSREDIEAALPGRTWKAPQRRAYLLGLVREREAIYPSKATTHPIFVELRKIRQRRRITRADLAKKIGYNPIALASWETGRSIPSFFALDAWCQSLGVSLKIDNLVAYVTPAIAGKPVEFQRKPNLAKLMAGHA